MLLLLTIDISSGDDHCVIPEGSAMTSEERCPGTQQPLRSCTTRQWLTRMRCRTSRIPSRISLGLWQDSHR